MSKVINLGWCVAKIEAPINQKDELELTVLEPRRAAEDNVFWPAASVLVFGRKHLTALRDALSEALSEEVK